MKRYNLNLRRYAMTAAALLSLGLAGCNDDVFLEEHPDTFYTAEDAFQTVSQVEACVTKRALEFLHLVLRQERAEPDLRGILPARQLCQPDA